MKYKALFVLLLLFILSGCASPNIAHKDQLMFQAPQDLMVTPPTLKKL